MIPPITNPTTVPARPLILAPMTQAITVDVPAINPARPYAG
jgi:hypothetical protein